MKKVLSNCKYYAQFIDNIVFVFYNIIVDKIYKILSMFQA